MLGKIMHYAQEYKDGKIDFLTLESAVDALLSASNDAKPIVSGALPSEKRHCFECNTLLGKEELFCGDCRRQ